MSKVAHRKKSEPATHNEESKETPTPANLEPTPAPVAAPIATPPVVAAVTPLPALTENGLTAEEEAELKAYEQRAAELKQAQVHRRNEMIKNTVLLIDSIPAQFGKQSLDEVVVMIRDRQQGQVGLNGIRYNLDGSEVIASLRRRNTDGTPRTGRGRGAIAPDLKEKIDADIKAARETAGVIAARHGVSVPYVQGRRKELGLVKARA